MKISLNWLQDFITLTITDPAEIARRVTAGAAEVDEVETLGALLDRCCVGKVLSVRKHPNADRLSLCDVQTDAGVKKVVCGGINLRVGMRVAFAHVGARVRWHGTEMVTLQKTGIRGEQSEGMICTSAELDIASRYPAKDEREVVDFGNPSQSSEQAERIGESLKEYLGLDDIVLHIDNHAITHRADLFSHVGFAREFVALGLGRWRSDRGDRRDRGDRGHGDLRFPKDALLLKCIVDCKELVPRYASCALTIDRLGETPAWMRKRLEATGWRCVSLPVDITNYVAMEIGMPLHSFDAADIRGEFHIRTSKKGESIVTLDGVERTLPEGALVLSDRDGIFDLLGIMGGLRSSTKSSTRMVYLHSAILDPASIRKAIIATGHRTDASTVYEKGVPREAATRGLLRAVELFTQLVPGCRILSKLEEWGHEGKPKPIALPLDRVSSVLGVEIPEKNIVKILEDLAFVVRGKGRSRTARTLVVSPPLHRLGDIRGAHDLIEEIGRIYGYNEIPVQMPAASIDPPRRDMRTHKLRDALQEKGYSEIVPISFLGEALLRTCNLDPAVAVEIHNPIGEDLKFLQISTLPGLLEHAQRNVLHASSQLNPRANTRLTTFHCARVFEKGKPEHAELGVLTVNLVESNVSAALLENPLLHLKDDLQSAFAQLGYQLDVAVAGSLPAFAHPGRYAELLVRSLPQRPDAADASHPFVPVGRICEVHPSIASRFDLPHRAAVAIVDLSAVLAVAPSVTVARLVPQFPSIVYDVTLTGRRLTEQVGDLLKRLRGRHEYLESVAVKDLYAARDSYNLTLTFTYRAHERTLTEDEVKPIHENVLAGV